MSAVSSVSTPGVLVTTILRAAAASQIDMIYADAEISDQLHGAGKPGQEIGVDSVRHGRNENVGFLGCGGDLVGSHGPVVRVEPGVEQFHHPGFDIPGQSARDDDDGPVAHMMPPCRRPARGAVGTVETAR